MTSENIDRGRLGGVLLVTRAFGDYELQECKLSVVPEVRRFEIEWYNTVIVVASDGVWDTLYPCHAIGIAIRYESASEGAKAIVRTAKKRGSIDNLSCYVIKL